VFNGTVVPSGPLAFLTLWPHGQAQPNVSTLNAIDGAIASNMAIVPTTDGFINAYANSQTQLILDISSYFAP
jgi:serine protease